MSSFKKNKAGEQARKLMDGVKLRTNLKKTFPKKTLGVLPSQEIRRMIKEGKIRSRRKFIKESCIQPASLDLTISSKAYRVSGLFLPKKGETVENLLKELTVYEVDLNKNFVLEKDATYVIELNEYFWLDEDIHAYSNNKSSTGRLNILTRIITDDNNQFDRIPKGYRGKLYLEVISKSFLIQLSEGDSLNQIIFFRGDSMLSDMELVESYMKDPVFFSKELKPLTLDKVSIHKGLVMTIDLSQQIIGWKSKMTNEVISLRNTNYYNPYDFFESIRKPENGRLVLNENEFYILCTKERIRIPTRFSAEMIAFDHGIGEFRSHDAGFFDPGFGYGKAGEVKGTTAVLEVRPYGNHIVIRDGQPVCKMIFSRLIEIPDKVYGVDLKSNYQMQGGPRLSKFFKSVD